MRKAIGNRSQREVAMKAGISPTAIGNYLLGRIPETTDIVIGLARVLNVSENRFLILAGYLPENCELVSDDPPIIVELRTSEPLSEEAKRQVIDFVTAWKAQHFPSQ